jgi:SAM-dependent methyltransferase
MNCIICGTKIKKIEKLTYKKKTYDICHCESCDIKFDKHIKKTSQKFYEELYHTWNVEGINIRGLIWGNHQFFRQVTNLQGNRKARVLDIGCADGLFVQEAIRRGYKAYGVDINPELIDEARKFYHIKTVYCGELSVIRKYVKEQFDVITFFDVLEHLEDPKGFIIELKKYLTKNGYVFVSIPNRDTTPRFLPLDGDLPPHHLTWWSKKSLYSLFEKNGYEVKAYKTQGIYPVDMAVWFDQLVTDKIKFFSKMKSSVQSSTMGSQNKSRLKNIYRLKLLEIKILTAVFFIPSLVLTMFGGIGHAQSILVKLEDKKA